MSILVTHVPGEMHSGVLPPAPRAPGGSQPSAFQVYCSTVGETKNSPLLLAARRALAQTKPAPPEPKPEPAAAGSSAAPLLVVAQPVASRGGVMVDLVRRTSLCEASPSHSRPLDSGTSSDGTVGPEPGAGAGPGPRSPLSRETAATATGLGNRRVAGIKLPIMCNDVRGIVFLDQQVVSCFCSACNARVAGGHDRPLFSFTRFERHSGSKAKKWRLSLRIDPGSVPECPQGDPPMPLGAWLDMRCVQSWNQRGAVRIGGSPESDSDDGAGVGAVTAAGSNAVATAQPQKYRRQACVEPMSAGMTAAPSPWVAAAERNAGGQGSSPRALAAAAALGRKRAREDYATPDPSTVEVPASPEWLRGRTEAFAVAARGTWRDRHAAVFHLAYGLLSAGPDRRALGEAYLPWLNDLGHERLEAEFQTLANYLALAAAGMAPDAVVGMARAYLRAVIARIS